MLGASSLYDNRTSLNEMGMDLPDVQDFDLLRMEDAAYMYVQAYCIKNHIALDAVRIANYKAIEDMEMVDEHYLDVLLKGANLGILELDHGRLLPDKQVEIFDLIQMIENIDWR